MRYLAILMAVMLSACATNKVTPYYQGENFSGTQNARLNFNEAKTVCRAENLEHHWMGDTQDLNIPNYNACMQKYGYQFNANGTAAPQDKSALYR